MRAGDEGQPLLWQQQKAQYQHPLQQLKVDLNFLQISGDMQKQPLSADWKYML